MEKHFNTRILVIDDDENVRLNFREILQPGNSGNDYMEQLAGVEDVLFSSPSTPSPARKKRSSATFNFELDEASNGKQGYRMVEEAISENRPYAAIFVDMRMPDWDGLETVRHVREIDARVEIIFVTAYSDHSIEEIVTAVGTNVSYHCKPFSAAEIEQIATKSVYEWNKTRSLEELIRNISKLRVQHWEMDALLNNILVQVAYLLGTHSALIAIKKNGNYEKSLAIGNLCDENVSQEYLKHIPPELDSEVYQSEDLAYFKMEAFGILAIFEKGGKPLNNERIYIIRLFLEQAAMAIRNVDLQESVSRQEKLSAIGQAIAMLFHDLRNSVGNITALAQLAIQRLDNREYATGILHMIGKSAAGAMKMASDLLDFAGHKPIEKEKILLTDVLLNIRENSEQTPLLQQMGLVINPSPDIEFMGDMSKLARVLLNLINNAAEALESAQCLCPQIILDTQVEDGKIIFRVSDNGPGLPEEIKSKLFVPFSTFGKTGGIGLGLAIAKRFVEDHDGEIKVESSSVGTEFIITIPGVIMNP